MMASLFGRGRAVASPARTPARIEARLAPLLAQRPDWRVFVLGDPTPGSPPIPLREQEWLPVTGYDGATVRVGDRTWPLDRIRGFVVAYPNGEVVEHHRAAHPLPDGLHFVEATATPVREALDPASLVGGAHRGRVVFAPAARGSKPGSYATTLENTSSTAIRVERFGAWGRSGDRYVLNTISGTFFTADQFRNWYGTAADGWIPPGASATDPNNYGGSGSWWIYDCVDRDGERFSIGGQVPEHLGAR